MAGTRKRISELDKITSPSSDDLFITDTNAGTKAITYNNLTSGLKSECEEYADGKVGDLTNLTTTEKASIVGAVNELDNDKVDKETGKGLSTNDYTTAEKNKLSGIDNGAEVNQNAFSNVKVGSTTVAAGSATDTLTLVAGSNVTITPDATNDKITIAAKDTTYGVATQSANGLMASTDKTKLNGIATGANKYTLPSASSSTLGGVKLSNSTTVTDSTGLALPVTEKNPNVSGSLANQISQLNTDLVSKKFDIDNCDGSACGYYTIEGTWVKLGNCWRPDQAITVLKIILAKVIYFMSDCTLYVRNKYDVSLVENSPFADADIKIKINKTTGDAYAHVPSYSYIWLVSFGRFNRSFETLDSEPDGELITPRNVVATSVANVPSKIISLSGEVTGSVTYTVINGICYVSIANIIFTVSGLNIKIVENMPKSKISECFSITNNTGKVVGSGYINSNSSNLVFHASEVNSDPGYITFSYPVIEN